MNRPLFFTLMHQNGSHVALKHVLVGVAGVLPQLHGPVYVAEGFLMLTL